VLFGVLQLMAVTFVVWSYSAKKTRPQTAEGPLETLRVVHLDLKGAPPKLRFLKILFPLIAAAGANAILIEYEDMFPFEGALRNASAKNAYSRNEVR